MAFPIERHEALSEEKLKTLRELRGEAYDQTLKITTFVYYWQNLVQKFETIRTDFLEQAQELALQEKRLVEDSNFLEQREKEVEIKLKRVDEELEMKEKELGSIKLQIEDSMAEFYSREIKLNQCNFELISTKQKVEECNTELSLKKKDLELVKKELEECEGELFLKGDILCDLSYELQMKEKELDSKKFEFNSIKQLIEEYTEELEDKDKKYDVMKSSVDEFSEKLKLKERELKLTEKSLNENSKKLNVEEKKLGSIQKYRENEEKKLNSLKHTVKDWQKELELQKELLRSASLTMKQSSMQLKSIQNSIMDSSGKLESKERSLDVVEKSLEECCNELALKEVQQGVIHIMCCENIRELQDQMTNFHSLQKTMEERDEKLQNKEKQLEEKLEMLESVKQQPAFKLVSAFNVHELGNLLKVVERKQKGDLYDSIVRGIPYVDNEQLDSSQSNLACSSSANSQFNASASESSPELLLNDVVDQVLTIDEISAGLRFSPDPAKLVLDVMRGSYFQFQSNGSAGFDACLMTNIVLLLERLMNISPKVSLQVKETALKQVSLWKDIISSETHNSSEVLAFLMFLAAYDLFSYCRRDEILNLVKTVVHHKQGPEICRVLGFIDEVAGLTADLIQRRLFLEAARFSKTFELSNKFLPQNILRNYLESVKMDVLLFIDSNSSFQEQLKTIDKKVEDLWECVVECELQSIFSRESCMEYIAGLQGVKAHPFSVPPCMSQQPLQGQMAQRPVQIRNPCMIGTSNPSYQPFLSTTKRPRSDPTACESYRGSISPQYDYFGRYFHAPN